MTTVDKSDIEAKLREIEGVVLEAEDKAKSKTMMVAAGVVAVVAGVIVYSMWRSRQNRIRVEVYRL
jgi:heme/copper-type cytochrome/quinol oxidase subunit 2